MKGAEGGKEARMMELEQIELEREAANWAKAEKCREGRGRREGRRDHKDQSGLPSRER